MGAAAPLTWQWTYHARDRCAEMGVALARVQAVLDGPELDYPSQAHPGRRLACGNELAVVYSRHDRAIITVLWHGREGRHEFMAA